MGKASRQKQEQKQERKQWKDPLPFDKFYSASLTTEQLQMMRKLGLDGVIPHQIFQNSRYEVWARVTQPEGMPTEMLWLSIKRRDKEPIDHNHWRELQRIKNEICGPDFEGVELYPNECRLVDTSNQYHMWILPPGVFFPFGFQERAVVGDDSSFDGSKQRPMDDGEAPADAMTGFEVSAFAERKMRED